ncbi:hypothetical protein AFLA_003049 [Aspergillus flavus NRRL3357]|nr:hypothetical protein AFLA_003049 [Aspergillus flavus NRRL3357]
MADSLLEEWRRRSCFNRKRPPYRKSSLDGEILQMTLNFTDWELKYRRPPLGDEEGLPQHDTWKETLGHGKWKYRGPRRETSNFQTQSDHFHPASTAVYPGRR